jgi:hypothetical protein
MTEFQFPPTIENPTDQQCYLIWTLYRAHHALTWNELLQAVHGMSLAERAMAIRTVRPMFPPKNRSER